MDSEKKQSKHLYDEEALIFIPFLFMMFVSSLVIIGIAVVYEAIFFDIFFLSIILGFFGWLFLIIISFLDFLQLIKKLVRRR